MGSIGGMSPGGSIALGIFAGLLSTSVQSLGLTLQRKSHILEDEKGPYDVQRPPYRRRRWQLGMGMFVISNVLGSSVQISTLPLPVLSTLQASGLVFNSVCATVILGEPFTKWSLWGTLLVCSGAVLIAVFGAIPSPTHKLSELLELLGRPPFVTWMSFQGVFVVGIAVAIELIAICTSLMQSVRFRLARGFAYGCISGSLSAHSLLVAKSAVELVLRSLVDGDNQFMHWQSWVLGLVLLTLAISQLYYLHRGLKLVSTSVLYPLIFCIYNMIAILDGLIYFDQTGLISPLRGCLITLGTAILLSGVLALSWRLHDEQHAPSVGQSALTPGLGFVEDTDGEDEEEEVLLYSDMGHEEGVSGRHSYQTFSSLTAPTTPRFPRFHTGSGSRITQVPPWAERAEIWRELEDRDMPDSPLPTPLSASRHCSSTILVSGETNPLLARSRTSGRFGGRDEGSSVAVTGQSQRLALRRRRRSTGFPGFTARKTQRRISGGIQDVIGAVWRMRWWRDKTAVEPA